MVSTTQYDNSDPHKQSFNAFMNEFVTESDRAAVVLGAAKIDSLLCGLLDKRLLPHPASEDDLLEGDAPLATFSARIRVCYRLGLIDEQFTKLLHIFRRLRNAFAHEVSQSTLATGSVRDRVLALAEPFNNSDFYQDLLEKISQISKRRADDPGVILRAVLTIFYIELQKIHETIEGLKRPEWPGVIESIADRKRPQEDNAR
mgnify:CR=1 FL=1